MADALDITPKTWNVGEIVTAAQMNTELRDKMLAIADRLTRSANDTTGYVIQPNWTLNTSRGRIANGVAHVYLNITYTGANVTADGLGNITNMDVCQLPPEFTPWEPAPLPVNATGYMASFFVWTNGMVGLAAVPPNVVLTNGHSFSIAGAWLLP